MSAPPPIPSRSQRLVELSPVLAAFALHAVAHGRWLLAAPVGLGLLALVSSGLVIRHTSTRLLLAGGAGALAGGLLLLVSEPPPDGPVPPVVLSPVCGLLVGLTALCVASRSRTYAWIYACLLAVLSLDVPPGRGVLAALVALAVSLLACAFAQGGLAGAGRRAVLGFGAFVLLLGGLAGGLTVALRAGEGMLMGAMYELLRDPGIPTGPGLQKELSIAALAHVQASSRPLLELSGARPGRLRTLVFDQFDGVRWTTSPALEETRLELSRPGGKPGPERSMELAFLEPLTPYLPAPAGTYAVEGARPRVLGGWVMRADRLQGAALVLRGDPEEELPPEPPPGPALTELPEALRAELRPLALELTRGAGTPREKAAALEAHFRDHYEYSLSVDLGGRGSPLAVLIRERRPAYCTYFASAMAALLRTLDVPARVVGGFAPEEENLLTGATVVRERDAHAWVEVYLADEGRFVPFDPTPWRSRDQALGVDADRPGVFGSAVRAVASAIRRGVSAVRNDPAGGLWAVVRSPVTWIALGALAAWRFSRRRREGRARRGRAAMGAADPRLAAAYASYLRALKQRAGLVPAPAETDEELLARLRAARGDAVADVAAEFLSRYRQARFRGAPAGIELLAELAGRLDAELRRER